MNTPGVCDDNGYTINTFTPHRSPTPDDEQDSDDDDGE